jgi:hypothetical protein
MAETESNGYIFGRPGTSLDAAVTGRSGTASPALVTGKGAASAGFSATFAGSAPLSTVLPGAVSGRPETSLSALASGSANTSMPGLVIGGEPDTFGLAIPLSGPVPLRNSTVWGQFVSPVPLPVGYGRITITPIPYDNTGRMFFLLDHAIQAVESLTRDDVADTQYTLENTTDDEGHAISLLQLAKPATTSEALTVVLRGKMHPDTGELLANPADILWDLLANLCNLPVEYGDLDAFRSECRDIGIEQHGLLESDTVTIRAQVDEIMASCGGVWSGGMPGIARIYPV